MAEQRTAEMPFLDHLEELRWRILWSLLAIGGGLVVGFVVVLHFRTSLLLWLQRPIAPYLHGQKLVVTHPTDAFNIVLTAAGAVSLVLALPVIVYQVWAFLSPALHKHERRAAIPVIAFALVLFLAGTSLAWFVVLPLAVEWLMGFATDSLQPMITAAEYFSFAISMTLAFGAAFQLPILILGLAAFGIVTPAMLGKFRRHAFVASVIIGAFLTPGDLIWTTIAMAVPLYFLYELSVVLSYVVERRRARRAAESARDSGDLGTAAT
ncbi:MAG: twin-arginine translocase subunit TatC [Gemmatimonadaceae bacterium]